MYFLQKKYSNYILKPFLKQYLKRPRMFRYKNLRLNIYPSVFHPKYFFSTEVCLAFFEKMQLANKTFCEVGAGSGIISMMALQMKAEVICFDLNPVAVEGLLENFKSNFPQSGNYKIYQSDLFDSIPKQIFDVVFINPPYFFKEITNDASLAWNCGENGDYFKKLFKQLPGFCNSRSQIFMALAENCELEKINQIAKNEDFVMELVFEKQIKWEKNFIFKLNLNGSANPA